MKPSDQAKLLFLYLLRSSAALATRATTTTTTSTTSITTTTTSSTGTAAAAAAKQVVSPPPASVVPGPTSSTSSATGSMGHINLRVATRLDVPSIQRCNLASLPENYSSNFYVNHIRSFPDLALVAEHVPPTPTNKNNKAKHNTGNGRRNPFDNYNPSVPEGQIIGYVLGKIEHPQAHVQSNNNLQPSKVSTGNDDLDDYLQQQQQQQQQNSQPLPEVCGHVTSLAVLKPYRRRGLAALLMKQLHFHMKYGHQATNVGLHVRVSNIAARRLYCEGMGYGVVDVIRRYYADGEDAFFMRKDLTVDPQIMDDEYSFMENQQNQMKQKQSRNPWSLRRKNKVQDSAVYQNGPLEFRLPMIIPLDDDTSSRTTASTSSTNVASGNDLDKAKDASVPDMVDDSPEEEDARVMTGSL